ncbi:hypothetical protein LTR01_003143 [Friedmanniomyces endolithicus]|nr:hypothetical protein LTS09_006149 [Friedmanniomyces endolithicus]KAK0311150.1 hypothetical protein LTR01_003143 [Friedmanniomyces endolithicus]
MASGATNRTDMWRPLLRSRRNLAILALLVVVGYISFAQLGLTHDNSGGGGGGGGGGRGAAYGMIHSFGGGKTAGTIKTQQVPYDGGGGKAGRWEFDVTVDRDNHSLTRAQCDQTFPLLYHELDRAKAYWKGQQGDKKIGPEQIDLKWSGDGGLSGMIYKQQLYVTHSRGLNHFGHWKERSHATLHQIQRAILTSPEPVPDIEFSIKINDKINLTPDDPSVTVWTFSRNIHDPVMERVWVIPDFNWWTYPRVAGAFGDFQRQAMAIQGDNFDSKRDQLVWRGTVDFNLDLRGPLMAQTDGQPWSDVRRIDEDAGDPFRITMPDHCRYKFAVHTEGTTWSGRLKYLLSCHSVVFVHRLSWYTHLYHLLNPSGAGQNYVQVENDWADLPPKMDELIMKPAKARLIADNAASELRDKYFTPAAQTCYWRRLFEVWSSVSFEPEPWEYIRSTAGDGGSMAMERRVKGMTYEEYV